MRGDHIDTSAPGWLTDAQRAASLDALMVSHPRGAPVWVFGYGSLLWKPAFEAVERRLGVVRGYHRRFCLLVTRFRGTDEAPGLMLALDRGGSCRGVAFRLDPATTQGDLEALWRREMVSAAYRPRWVTVATAAGPVRAITFTANRGHARYVRVATPHVAAAMIARAAGPGGTCAEYLAQTVRQLEELGIGDRTLVVLHRLVAGSPPLHGGAATPSGARTSRVGLLRALPTGAAAREADEDVHLR